MPTAPSPLAERNGEAKGLVARERGFTHRDDPPFTPHQQRQIGTPAPPLQATKPRSGSIE
jgi:hypothetical protein